MRYCSYCVQNYKTKSDVCEECGGHLIENTGWNLGFLFMMLSALAMLLLWACLAWGC